MKSQRILTELRRHCVVTSAAQKAEVDGMVRAIMADLTKLDLADIEIEQLQARIRALEEVIKNLQKPRG